MREGPPRRLPAHARHHGARRRRSVHVVVRGYDEQGRGKAIAGATVRLGGATATTGADGAATLRAPAGRHRLSASKPGLVPAFPQTVTVG